MHKEARGWADKPSVKERFPGVDLGRVEGLMHTESYQNRKALLNHRDMLEWTKIDLSSSERGYSNPIVSLEKKFSSLYPKLDQDLVALLKTQGWTQQEIDAAWDIDTRQVLLPEGWPQPGSLQYAEWWQNYEERTK